MKITRDNYRVEIPVDPNGTHCRMPHEWLVEACIGKIADIERAGITIERARAAWDQQYWCENCGEEIEQEDDEMNCSKCGRLMCFSCNYGSWTKPVCEDCYDKEEVKHEQ